MGKKEATKDEPMKVKQRVITINSEKEDAEIDESNHSAKAFMPNLPKPLNIEEKKYLLAVERGDTSAVRRLLQKSHRHPEFMDKDCVDPMGRGALHMAIDNENLEMVELLIVMGVLTKDALLHAINVEFVEAVEVLLEHEEVIHKEGESYSWEKVDRQTAYFTPEITPLILAAHRDNYEILKILLDRGATLPMPHDIRCGCQECIRSSSEDSLRHSMSRINSYRALASPSLIALSSTDPILTAFELSWELKILCYSEQEFRSQYLELRKQCLDFAEALLSHTRSSTELAVILNYDPDALPYEDGEHMKLQRLELAIEYNQKKFVAHPNVQQLLAAIWYEGLPGFRRKGVVERLMEILKVVVLFPLYCVHYMIMPESPNGKLMRTPFMKFLVHSSSYLFFLLLLILVSVRFEDNLIYFLGTENMRKSLEESRLKQRGTFPRPTECFAFIYVFGFIAEEIQEMRSDGIRKYFKNMWNILDVLRDTLYISTIILRVGAFIQQNLEIAQLPQIAYTPKEDWDTSDPQLISEGLFSAANILSALKLVHIFSINPYLGPLQISLGRMVIDIVKFFFIYSLVLFSFACGLTQLLWYYNDLEKQKCYSLQGGLPDWTKQGEACMKWRRFHNLFEATQSLFWAGFGMIGLSDFELTGIREYTRFWSMLMFGTFSVINIIVLLNLLIAMMSSSYSFIVEHADTEWKFARTKLWMSYFEEGRTLPPPFNIFPNIKLFRKIFGTHEKDGTFRRMSTRTRNIKQKVRDYRYLGVMRALIWRYVCSLQTRSLESPVTEDNINEIKGDISSLRFELIDLFGNNGMDISNCAKKNRGALGRKMKIWERRLMRDFHVSPAMGTDDVVPVPVPLVRTESRDSEGGTEDTSAADRFRRIARLAMMSKVTDMTSLDFGKGLSSQIGRTNLHDDKGRENLKKAMEKARKKMEEGTPDGSPTSSRGCSPYPDLYTGPHLLDAIKNLELSPSASPMPPRDLETDSQASNGIDKPELMVTSTDSVPQKKSFNYNILGNEKESSLLAIPSKPQDKILKESLNTHEINNLLSNTRSAIPLPTASENRPAISLPTTSENRPAIPLPTTSENKPAIPLPTASENRESTQVNVKTIDKTKVPEKETKKKIEDNKITDIKPIPPVTVSTVSELNLRQTNIENEKSQKKSKDHQEVLSSTHHISLKDKLSPLPCSNEKKQNILSPSKVEIKSLFKTGDILLPSSIKTDGYQPLDDKPHARKDIVKPPALRIDFTPKTKADKPLSSIVRPRPLGIPVQSAGSIPGKSLLTLNQAFERKDVQKVETNRKTRYLPPQDVKKTNETQYSLEKSQKNINLLPIEQISQSKSKDTYPKLQNINTIPVCSPPKKKSDKKDIIESPKITEKSITSPNVDQYKLKKTEKLSNILSTSVSSITTENLASTIPSEPTNKLELNKEVQQPLIKTDDLQTENERKLDSKSLTNAESKESMCISSNNLEQIVKEETTLVPDMRREIKIEKRDIDIVELIPEKNKADTTSNLNKDDLKTGISGDEKILDNLENKSEIEDLKTPFVTNNEKTQFTEDQKLKVISDQTTIEIETSSPTQKDGISLIEPKIKNEIEKSSQYAGKKVVRSQSIEEQGIIPKKLPPGKWF